jgi:hypothetical protein
MEVTNGCSLRVLTLTCLLGVQRGPPTAKPLPSRLRSRRKVFVRYVGQVSVGDGSVHEIYSTPNRIGPPRWLPHGSGLLAPIGNIYPGSSREKSAESRGHSVSVLHSGGPYTCSIIERVSHYSEIPRRSAILHDCNRTICRASTRSYSEMPPHWLQGLRGLFDGALRCTTTVHIALTDQTASATHPDSSFAPL